MPRAAERALDLGIDEQSFARESTRVGRVLGGGDARRLEGLRQQRANGFE
jgi:hypothetical protein